MKLGFHIDMALQKIVRILLPLLLIIVLLLTAHIVVKRMQSISFQTDANKSGASFWKERSFVVVGEGEGTPLQFPGPLDSWAGGETKQIRLTVPVVSPGDRLFLRMHFADSHESVPPLLEIALNGKAIDRRQVSKGAGEQPALWPGRGKPSRITVELPKLDRKGASLKIIIRSLEGSWVGFNKITVFSKVSVLETRAVKVLWVLLAVFYLYFLTFPGNFKRCRAKTKLLAHPVWGTIERSCRNPPAMAFITFIVVMTATGVIREDLIPFNADENKRIHLVTGDEPEYFLAAYSVAHDFDMDVSNNIRNKDWARFVTHDIWGTGHGSLNYFKRFAPKIKDVKQEEWGDMQLLVHRPALSVLLAPAAYSETRMRWWSYILISCFGATFLALIVLTASSAGIYPFMAAVTSTGFALTPPSLFYLNQAFPEIPMAMIIALVLVLMIKPDPWRLYATAVLICIAPWFSDRILLAAFILGIGCLALAKSGKERVVLVGMFATGAILLVNYYMFRFGVPWPIDHNPRVHASLSEIPFGLPRIFMDAGRGVVWLTPVLILAPSAFYAWWRSDESRILLWFLSTALAVTMLLISSHPDWTGGGGPTGRYGMVFIWLSLPAFLMWFKTGITITGKILFFSLLLFGVLEGYMVSVPAGWMYSKFHPLFQYGTIANWYGVLPNLAEYTTGSIIKAVAWFFFFTVLAISAVFPFKRTVGQ